MNRQRPFGNEGVGKDPEGPSFDDLYRERMRKERRPKPLNFDRRFGTPVFTPRKFERIPVMYRYPRIFIFTVVTTSVLIVYSRWIYEFFFAPTPVLTPEDQARVDKYVELTSHSPLRPIKFGKRILREWREKEAEKAASIETESK